MTKVSFYHLGSDQAALLSVLCTLIGDSLPGHRHILVRTTEAESAVELGNGLEARLQLGASLGVGPEPERPVSLCWGDCPGDHHGLLINLGADLPAWFSRFERLAELVWGDGHFIAAKRDTFRLLRHRGYPVHYRDLTGTGGGSNGLSQ